MKYIKLNTGSNIPLVGSGTNTFGKVNHDYAGAINGDTRELDSAIHAGYRLFDTAIAYRNEAVVGEAIKKSGIDRSEFFLVSKIPGKPEYTHNEAAVQAAVQASLQALQTDYIDLYLIHHPWENEDEMAAVWQVLEAYVDQGILKAIGVSNFDCAQLEFILQIARIEPAVNQIESHPGHWNDDVIDYALAQGIYPVAWSPLSRTAAAAIAQLTEIGDRYGKDWAQVILRYQIERDVIVIPKSHHPERQRSNLDLFDFELTQAEREIIRQL